MTLKNRLLGRKNRTAQWVQNPSLNRVVDLSRHALCGVAIGEAIDGLAGLGPAENVYAHTGLYHYLKQGFYLVEEEGLLETIVLLLLPEKGGRPFNGSWVYKGRDLPITAQSTPQDIRWFCGDPYHQFTEQQGELVWFYEFPGVEWQISWLPEGTLTDVEIGIPELATPEARTWYGVSKPWLF